MGGQLHSNYKKVDSLWLSEHCVRGKTIVFLLYHFGTCWNSHRSDGLTEKSQCEKGRVLLPTQPCRDSAVLLLVQELACTANKRTRLSHLSVQGPGLVMAGSTSATLVSATPVTLCFRDDRRLFGAQGVLHWLGSLQTKRRVFWRGSCATAAGTADLKRAEWAHAAGWGGSVGACLTSTAGCPGGDPAVTHSSSLLESRRRWNTKEKGTKIGVRRGWAVLVSCVVLAQLEPPSRVITLFHWSSREIKLLALGD